MYAYALILHGALRWIVLVAGTLAVFVAIGSAVRSKPWNNGAAEFSGKLFVGSLDAQVLLGAVLFFLLSPLTTSGLTVDPTAADSDLSFVSTRHPALMFMAFVLVHLTAVAIRRARSDGRRHLAAVIGYGVGMAMIASAIPWARPLLRW